MRLMAAVQPPVPLAETEPLLLDAVATPERRSYEAHERDDPLIQQAAGGDYAPIDGSTEDDGEAFDNVPKEKRRLGLWSTTFIGFNVMVGSGIYATPSLILRSSGSVGFALVLWLAGALFAAIGAVVYIELGTGLPRSGGQKNYLEFIYRKPKYLASCIFIAFNLSTRTSAASAVVFGEYVMRALGISPSSANTRVFAIFGLTLVTFLHSTRVQWGIRLNNALGTFKIAILSVIAIAGLLSLAGVSGFEVRKEYEQPHNLEWEGLWKGTNFDVHEIITGSYNVIWSFAGYSHINYTLSEVKHPIRTVKYASALALLLATVFYLSINIAYFAVISKNDILSSRTIVVSLFFRNLFGEGADRLISAIVALSVLGSFSSDRFAQGRVIQELGREGILPFSEVIASNKPFGAPLAALCIQYVVSCAVLLLTPAGDAFLFLLSYGSYCTALVNTFIAFGVILMHTRLKAWRWNPPFRAPNSIVFAYLMLNIFLIVFPFIPPSDGKETYANLPYWSHAVAAFTFPLVGYAYWYWFTMWHPRKNGYRLEREWVMQDDGVSRHAFRRISDKEPEEVEHE